jgi:hypothetical protein
VPNDRVTVDYVDIGSEEQRLADPYSPLAPSKLPSSTAKAAFVSNAAQDMDSLKKEPSAKKATTETTTNESVASAPRSKSQHPVKVQPKRLLEDCLTVLDHNVSDSSAGSAASTNSTIYSRPDTKLDMNSVWVEMLLHNQMALSRTSSESR